MTDFTVGVDVRAHEYFFITSLNVCLLRQNTKSHNIVRSNQSSLQID